jgi:hypothetical protein
MAAMIALLCFNEIHRITFVSDAIGLAKNLFDLFGQCALVAFQGQ